MTSRQIEMTWRCTSCSEKNLGRFKVCQACHNPKDGSEEYEMPDDPSKAASVTEESLLRMALSGPDWRCAYCGSDQRAADQGCANCGASALEGDEVPDDPREVEARAAVKPEGGVVSFGGLPMAALEKTAAHEPNRSEERLDRLKIRARRRWIVGGVAAVLALVAAGQVHHWNSNRPRNFEARVTSVSWERTIDVERYVAKPFEGFKENLPADALKVTSLGERLHHHDSVPDGFTTERYSEQVDDGYRTESYTERVSCGETCTSKPQSCREKCRSNKNGFATCKTECTGGGESCRTKYCNERRTRQVPKKRTEWRTRQVTKYRDVPRYAEAFSWVQWVWEPNRTVRASGTDVTVRWPTSNLGQGLADGEKEREQRHEQYRVTLGYGDDQSVSFVPRDEAEFAKYPPQSKHPLHTQDGRFELDGAPVTPVR